MDEEEAKAEEVTEEQSAKPPAQQRVRKGTRDSQFDYERYKSQDPVEKQMCEMETQLDQLDQQKYMKRITDQSVEQMSEMSCEEIEQRRLFLTDIGRRSLRFHKIYGQPQVPGQIKSSEKQQSESQLRSQYFVERNKRLAWLDDIQKLEFESEIDKLPQEARDRLNALLADIEQLDD